MKKFASIFFLIVTLNSFAQQFPQYTQFVFNKIGYNPAASGTSPNALYEVIFGGRTQWIGFENNPKSAFVSFNYNFVPTRSFKKWHNVGAYIAQDNNGAFIHNDIWLSYSFHLMVSRKMLLSAGIFAGTKQFRLNNSFLDPNDPAIKNSSRSLFAIPDVVPGIRLSSKKFFMDFCVQHATVFSQRGIGGAIGSPSKVVLNYNSSIGKKFKVNDFDNLQIALNIRGSFRMLPTFEINVMNYYNRKFAVGASVRSKNFAAAIIQFRMLKNLSIGLAYDLSINRMFRPAAHTGEIMVSFSPLFGGELGKETTQRILDDCSF